MAIFTKTRFCSQELEEALFLDAGVEESDFITNLVVQLLRGIQGLKSITSEDYLEYLRSVMKEKWELGEKRVNPLNSQDVTFKMLPTLTKVEILHALCDYRLDAADVAVLKDYDGDNLRVEPLGTDRTGATYWYFYGTRLYKEDRQLTEEERKAKHKQKLKEKHKRKKDRLKAIKNMKEARRKQKQTVKKGKSKEGVRVKKKKRKSSKISDDECNNEQLTVPKPSNSNKYIPKGRKRTNTKGQMEPVTSSKLQKDTKSKKQLDTNQSRMKSGDKPKKTSGRKQNLKKETHERKQEIMYKENERGKLKRERSGLKKQKASKAETQQNAKNASNSQPYLKKAPTSTKGGKKTNEGSSLQVSPCKSRKRKVIKSKAIISESDDDSDDDQPLQKLAKNQVSHMDVTSKVKQKKLNKSHTACKYQAIPKTKERKATNSRSRVKSKGDNTQEEADKKPKKLSKATKKVSDIPSGSSEEDLSSCMSIPQSSDTETDSEDDLEPPRWHLVCHSQEDWQRLTDFFKKSKVKCEKELYKTLANDFLPEIHSLFAAKEKALRKKLQELAPRRASSRVVIMQLKREEEERLKAIEEAELSSRRQQIEEEKREKMKLRNKLQHRNQDEHSGDKSLRTSQITSHQKRTSSKQAKKTKSFNGNIYARLQQVYDAVSKHEDSWPFMDPVDEAYAPAYYQIIIKPMCLNIIEKKIKKKDYKTKEEFEQDMNQLFTNCLEYNGPGNEYTLMAENLKSCLEYNMEKIFPEEKADKIEKDSTHHVDQYAYQRPPQRQSAKNANTRLEKLEDKVYARLRGLSSSESSIFESQDSPCGASDDDEDMVLEEIKYENTDSDYEDRSAQLEILKSDPVDKDKSNDLKVFPCTKNDPVTSTSSHIKQDNTLNAYLSESSTVDYSQHEDQTKAQTLDEIYETSTSTSSRKGDQNDGNAVTSRGVIAFAPSSGLRELSLHTSNKDVQGQDYMQSCSDKEQDSEQCKDNYPNEMSCKEHSGQMSFTPLQGSRASKVNRVKPIQNVRPYVPDCHSEDRGTCSTSQSVPCDQHEATQQASQGPPAMIDLNSRRPNVLNPETSSSSEKDFHVPCQKENTFGLSQDLPQENLYVPSSLSQGFQHSKKSTHSGTKSNPQYTQHASKDEAELPAPLTVPPVQESVVQHVPAVQPLLPSSNALEVPHWKEEHSLNARSSSCESTQKLWHPLGLEDKTVSVYNKTDKSTSSVNTMANQNQGYLGRMKLPQTGVIRTPQNNSQSSNILESLLHRQPNSSVGNISEAHRSRQLVLDNLPAQREMGSKTYTCVPPVCSSSYQGSVQLHNQRAESVATNSNQSVTKQPEKTVQPKPSSSGILHYPQSSVNQSNVASRVEPGKGSMTQLQMSHTDTARGIDTMLPVRKSDSFLSMLTSESRSTNEYKDHFDMQRYAGSGNVYNQALYSDHLRLHASQASAVTHGYSAGSHLSHLLQGRQKSEDRPSSAFTPLDPYSSHSAFRMQRPNPTLFPQYMGQQEAEQLARQQYQQHLHQRAGVGTRFTAYRPQASHTHPDMAYYSQHGIGSQFLGSQAVGGVGAPMPYDPAFLSHPPHMQGYK
ncbi:uncharacterized protein LOC110988947 isoform X2 [Acanthaster planci]|uniref:Uncharacterized protein LOC110988947 isoform X2 n=1 Tax=Acanthaster planci TaxID=133434 RepID=A0A8B7ZV40_ACAPL|nr:uncharacterized protein LOC110988947 isoform X2 [Acanthaster planci]